ASSVFAFLRRGNEDDADVLVVANLTPAPHHAYRVGVPHAGRWAEILNSDADIYGGSNMGNGGGAQTTAQAAHGFAQSVALMLPPLAVVFLRHDR
ncbi:MAG TPA: alpha amylase C-terminal domain-containing protein, partial [Rudaea sp.]|nr:alpha amylase C-terminal domain-containing protein [Rudaea sp.]